MDKKKKIKNQILRIMLTVNSHHTGAYAAQAAYFFVLSLIPILLLLVYMAVRYTPLNQNDVLNAVLQVFPASVSGLMRSIFYQVYNQSETVIPVTIIVALWAAGRGVLSVTSGLNAIYSNIETRNYFYLRIRSTIYTLLFLIAIILSLVISVFGNSISVIVYEHVPFLIKVVDFIMRIRTLVTLIVLIVFWDLVYKFLPNRKHNVRTTFRKQLPGTDSATVHMYQGREKDAIIMSVVDNRISSFADDPSMLNVAVSRARKKFCLVVTGNRQTRQGNITDLLDYIEYNNCSITDSKITSIFDILYRQYTEQLTAYLEKHPKISRYPSENLTYGLICDIISSDIRFSCLEIKREYPLRDLIKDTSLMSEEETLYASREGTHIDFLISNTVSMKPVLAVETDGYSYHNCSGEQIRRDRMKDHILQTYGIPLVRLSTKGSGEKEKIVSRLMELMHIGNP